MVHEIDGNPGGLSRVHRCNPDGGSLVSRKPSAAAAVFPNLTIQMSDLDRSSKAYTSLENLLQTTSTSVLSPVWCNSSWDDIPIKDPLLKQAAWAYLRPMASVASTGKDCHGVGFFRMFRWPPSPRGGCGCVAWMSELVVKAVRKLISGKKRTHCLLEEELMEEEDENFAAGRGDYGGAEKLG